MLAVVAEAQPEGGARPEPSPQPQTSAQGNAQSQQTPQLLSILTIDVKPGANAQFEEFIAKYREAAERTGSALRWLAASSETGSSRYSFARPFGSFSALADEGPDLMKVYGPDEARRLMGVFQAAVSGMATAIYTARPDLSRPGPQSQTAPVAVLFIDVTVRPNREADFEDLAKKVVEASDATAPEAHWNMFAPLFGGGSTYRVVVDVPSWNFLDKPPKPIEQRLREHFGEGEAQRLNELMTAVVDHVDQSLNRVRPELARPPAGD
jgi:hypothetical protein